MHKMRLRHYGLGHGSQYCLSAIYKYGESLFGHVVALAVLRHRNIFYQVRKQMLTISVPATAKVGEAYNVSFLLWNNGGRWRVVSMELVFDAAGEHHVTIGNLSTTITVE